MQVPITAIRLLQLLMKFRRMRWPFCRLETLTCVRECRDCRDLLWNIVKDIQFYETKRLK
jgi:hypothetical protein